MDNYIFEIMEIFTSDAPAGDVILIYTQQYRLNIHHGSVILYDVL